MSVWEELIEELDDYVKRLEDENLRLRQQLEKGEVNESTNNKDKRN